MGLLQGRRALVMGVATRSSIAWAIARTFRREGAVLGLSYQNERLGREVRRLAPSLGDCLTVQCDVDRDDDIESAIAHLADTWGGIDVIVHAIAHAPRKTLRGDFLEGLDRESFLSAHATSSYSLSAVAGAARARMPDGGAILTLSYLGAVRSVAHYNVMGPAKASLEASVRYLAAALGPQGIRVNAISAGPIRTLAASGIAGLGSLLEQSARDAPLGRNVTAEEVGEAAAFLCSPRASGVTGQTVYVDAGLSSAAGASHR